MIIILFKVVYKIICKKLKPLKIKKINFIWSVTYVGLHKTDTKKHKVRA